MSNPDYKGRHNPDDTTKEALGRGRRRSEGGYGQSSCATVSRCVPSERGGRGRMDPGDSVEVVYLWVNTKDDSM